MIHYHGTPIGGDNINAMRFLKGKHALVSYAHQNQMDIVAEVCQSFILDNGAFTAWKKGGQVDYEGYIDFVEKWHRHPSFDWAIIPDVIGGDEDVNDRLLEFWPSRLKGVPVFHLDEDVNRLIRLANKYECVAFGSSAKFKTAKSFWARMETVMEAICDEQGRPICKIHGLRMLDPEVFTKIPLSSADSTNAGRNNDQLSRHGQYASKCAIWIRTLSIADSVEHYNSSSIWVGSKQISMFH